MTMTPALPARIGKAAVGALGLLAVSCGALESVVQPTIPLLQRELGMGPTGGALLGILLPIAGTLATPLAGRLGDRYGGKRVLVPMMIVVCVGGLMSALAPGLPVLLIGQLLQGAMVGALPLSFVIVRKYLSAGESKVAIGVVSGFFVGGGMAGTLLAGPVAEQLSRHWMFALPTFAVIAATLLVLRLVPKDPADRPDDAGFDWPGLALLSGALITFMLGLNLAPDLGPLALLGLVLLLAAFVAGWIAVERRAASPMIDLRLLARPMMWKSSVLTFLICVGTAMSIFLVTQLWSASGDGYGFAASPTEIGLFLVPGTVAATLAGPLGGGWERRSGSRAVATIGVVVMAVALIGMAAVHSAAWHLVVGKALVALANGLIVTAMTTSVATSVASTETGVATSLVLVTRVLGMATGGMLGGVLLDAGNSSESSYATGFLLAGVVTSLALLITRTMHKGAKA
ncbi:MFS transporter [Amycolatopsis silviterrae]|uniref:MFS transporter n=1 Tax=Amycolatopsis silviterrae TaxID=1656914 RepID=A0ABW5HAP1_9PSEU